jgi:ABC-type Fe3+/spermidine/putrescine transport system ATPase subunit
MAITEEHRKMLARAYQEAMGRLRKRHDSEFHEILAEVYAEKGMEVKKRLSRAQKQQQRVAEARSIIEASTGVFQAS